MELGKIFFVISTAFVLLFSFGCVAVDETGGVDDKQPLVGGDEQPLIGGDKDEHGCIGSAGYVWCEELNDCIRPWETKCEKVPEPIVGGDKDEHGCIGSAGYVWCETSDECIRPWETECKELETTEEINVSSDFNSKAKEHCSDEGVSAVYVCGDYYRVVSDMPGAGSVVYMSDGSKFNCPIVAPEMMQSDCKAILLGSNCAEDNICTK